MKNYIKPTFQIIYIKIEDTYANSSALIQPTSEADGIQTEWDLGTDVENNFFWE